MRNVCDPYTVDMDLLRFQSLIELFPERLVEFLHDAISMQESYSNTRARFIP